MLELPECITLCHDLGQAVVGKTVKSAVANGSAHKFTFYSGDPSEYGKRLQGRSVTGANEYGFYVELVLDDTHMLFRDGVNLRYYPNAADAPAKHQLLVTFSDGSALCATVSMYGSIALEDSLSEIQDAYFNAAKNGVRPLSGAFDMRHFDMLIADAGDKQSAKALLATQQRVIGIGNGVLQDILFIAKVHPKRKLGTLSSQARKDLFASVKTTLQRMVEGRGRNTEKDLFGEYGGYQTLLCKNTVDTPCPVCGDTIRKTAYMGGSVYYCETCQKLS